MTQDKFQRGRLKKKPAQAVIEFLTIPGLKWAVERLYQEFLDCNKAHVLMLAKRSIITREVCRAILQVNDEMAKMGKPTFEISPEKEEIYFNLESYLIDKVGIEIGGQQHTARSRNDLYTATWRLGIRKYHFQICKLVNELRKQILCIAEGTTDAVMAGHTHLQPSEPITFAHYLCAISSFLSRDFHRLKGAYETINECSLGGTSMGSTTFPIDREMTSELLGFDHPVLNSLDCVSTTDFMLEFMSALAIMNNNLCRFCNDLYVWNSPDFGYIELDDSVTCVSSIMPQKKNPLTLEGIKGKTGTINGDLMAGMSSARTMYYTFSMDFSEILGNVFNCIDESIAILSLMIATLKDIKVRKERMLHNAEGNYCTVTELANALVRHDGISFRAAHRIVAKVVGHMLDKGLKANEIDTVVINLYFQELFNRSTSMTEEDLQGALDPRKNSYSKKTLGGPAPEETMHQIAVLRGLLNEDIVVTESRENKVKEAKERLESLVQEAISA